MTDRSKAAREHGILDERALERPLDRRRFLAHLGAGALGAAMLNLGDATSGFASAFTRPAVTGAQGLRPIYMVALGDSVMWGQGLSDGQKFQTKIASWIQTTHPDRRPVQRWNFAHSGATLGGLKGLGTASGHHTTGQVTAAVLGKSSTTPLGAEFTDIPDFEPRGRLPRPTGNDAAPPSSGRPFEPSAGDTLGGEIPRSFPSLWRQLDIALETLRTGIDPRDAKGRATPKIDPADVDLVLLNGGANDVDFLATICNFERNAQQTYDNTRAVVESRMRAYLPNVLAAFPNATFVMPTYYHGISAQSTAAGLTPMVLLILRAVANVSLLAAVAGGTLAANQIPGLIARNDAMERAIADSYRALAATAPGRIHVVSPGFAPANAYGASQSFLFHLEDIDPAEPIRKRECDVLLGKWLGNVFGGERNQLMDTPVWALCNDASLFHPNVAGANHYFMKIRDSLVKTPPPFMRGLPKIRVVVNGTTAGDTKTVTVTAFDAQSGTPVTGTVAVAGMSGQTGAAISYKATACSVEGGTAPDLGAGPGDGPVTRPTGARAGRAGTTPVRAAAVVPCAGKVVVPGYAEATFRY